MIGNWLGLQVRKSDDNYVNANGDFEGEKSAHLKPEKRKEHEVAQRTKILEKRSLRDALRL